MSERAVADELAIRELVTRYADAVVRRDAGAWSRTWAEDAEWQIAGRVARGREEIVKLWKELMSGVPAVIQIPHECLIRIESSDAASARWYVTEHAQLAGGQGMLMIGIYQDDYGKESGAWRFARRRFHALYSGVPDLSGSFAPFPAGLDGEVPE